MGFDLLRFGQRGRGHARLRRRVQVGLCAAALATLTPPTFAQTISDFDLGAPVPEGLPAPFGSLVDAPFIYTRWMDETAGVALSTTADAETGEIFYVERWRADPSVEIETDIEGLFYGTSTLADIQAHFGSVGIVFEGRGRFAATDTLALFFTTYEITDADQIISFVTILPLAGATPEDAALSVLDSVIWADGAYIDGLWGINRGRLPGSEPVPSPFSGPQD